MAYFAPPPITGFIEVLVVEELLVIDIREKLNMKELDHFFAQIKVHNYGVQWTYFMVLPNNY